ASAAHRCRRNRARADRPRLRQEPPRRFDRRADAPGRLRRALPRPGRSGAAEGVLRRDPGAATADPRLPRPLRRRPVHHGVRHVYLNKRDHTQRTWSEITYRMQALRDHPESAREEFDRVIEHDDPGLSLHLTFTPSATPVSTGARPRVAILREQGVNGQVEM